MSKNSAMHLGLATTIFAATVATVLAVATSDPAIASSRSSSEANAAQPTWAGRAKDAWMDGKIEASYALNPYLNPFSIDTEVNQGVVRLTGVVESQIDKDLAEEIAKGIDDVTEVQNDLVVEPDAKNDKPEDRAEASDAKDGGRGFARRVSDATTTARVKLALIANSSADGLRIDVGTENGVVSLRGSVDSNQQSQLAEKIAENTEGVSSVENHLKVETS
jgi:osmotically-inducible protein OsmY